MSLSEAKRIFREYAGDPWLMGREGVWDRYRELKVPQALERQWSDEYVGELLLAVDESPIAGFDDHSTAIFRLLKKYKSDTGALALARVAGEISPRLDTFSKLMLAEGLIELAVELNPADSRESPGRAAALKAVEHLLSLCGAEKVTVDNRYLRLGSIVAEDKIRQRIGRAHDKLRKALDPRSWAPKPDLEALERRFRKPWWKFW